MTHTGESLQNLTKIAQRRQQEVIRNDNLHCSNLFSKNLKNIMAINGILEQKAQQGEFSHMLDRLDLFDNDPRCYYKTGSDVMFTMAANFPQVNGINLKYLAQDFTRGPDRLELNWSTKFKT